MAHAGHCDLQTGWQLQLDLIKKSHATVAKNKKCGMLTRTCSSLMFGRWSARCSG